MVSDCSGALRPGFMSILVSHWSRGTGNKGAFTLTSVSFAINLMGKRELVALLSLSSWCLVMVVWLFLAVPWICLRFVIVVFSDHTHYL